MDDAECRERLMTGWKLPFYGLFIPDCPDGLLN
jgi:hypothetical protein